MLLNMLPVVCSPYAVKHVAQQVMLLACYVICYKVYGEMIRRSRVEQHVTKNRTGSIFVIFGSTQFFLTC